MSHAPKLGLDINPYHPERSYLLAKQMIQSWSAEFYPGYLLFIIPLKIAIFMLSAVLLGIPWAVFVVYWCKPLYERIAIFGLGRLSFGIPFTLKEWRKHSFQAIFNRRTLLDLTLTRFSPKRSYKLCIYLLEGKKGSAFSARLKSLGGQGTWHVWTHGIMFLWIPPLISISVIELMRFVLTLSPSHSSNDFGGEVFLQFLYQLQDPLFFGLFLFGFLVWLLLDTFFEVWHTSCGFAQYLINRTRIEGWHIERFWRQHQQEKQKLIRNTLLGCLAFLFLSPPDSSAAALTEDIQRASQNIQQIIQSADYGRIEYKDIEKDSTLLENIKLGDLPPQSSNLPSISTILYIVLAIFLAAIAYLIWRLKPAWLGLEAGRRRLRRKKPESVAGFNVLPESLPSDMPAEIAELLRTREYRLLLSLLIRSTLRTLIEESDIYFLKGDTEKDCIQKVQQSLFPLPYKEFFTDLMQSWQTLAYAHISPEDAEMQVLVERWVSLFHKNSLKQQLSAASTQQEVA